MFKKKLVFNYIELINEQINNFLFIKIKNLNKLVIRFNFTFFIIFSIIIIIII